MNLDLLDLDPPWTDVETEVGTEAEADAGDTAAVGEVGTLFIPGRSHKLSLRELHPPGGCSKEYMVIGNCLVDNLENISKIQY